MSHYEEVLKQQQETERYHKSGIDVLDAEKTNKKIRDASEVLLAKIRSENDMIRKIPNRKTAYTFLTRIAGELGMEIGLQEAAITMALNDMYNYGKLQKYMDSPFVSDIQVYSDYGTFVIDKGERFEATESIMSYDEVMSFILRKLSGTNFRFDLSNPRTDAILPDGSRLHVRGGANGWTVKDEDGRHIERDCITMTIRRPLYNFTLDELQGLKMFTPDVLTYLEWVQRIGDTWFIGGDVGSGKSTLMSALIGKLPPRQMSCVMEEMPELQPLSPWVARLYTRPMNAQGKGAITMNDNLVDTLRMMFDNVYVGETRTGTIAYDFLETAQTVTNQCGTTCHVIEGVAGAIQRFILLAYASPLKPTMDTVCSTFGTVVRQVIVSHKTRFGKRITEIGEVFPYDYEKKAIPYIVVAKHRESEDIMDFFGTTDDMVHRALRKGLTFNTLKVQDHSHMQYVRF